MIGHALYTDGSRKDRRTGAGFVAFYNRSKLGQYCERLDDNAMVFQAEAIALARAADFVSSNEGLYAGRHVTIYSASRLVLEALSSARLHSRVVKFAAESLNKAGKVASSLQPC